MTDAGVFALAIQKLIFYQNPMIKLLLAPTVDLLLPAGTVFAFEESPEDTLFVFESAAGRQNRFCREPGSPARFAGPVPARSVPVGRCAFAAGPWF